MEFCESTQALTNMDEFTHTRQQLTQTGVNTQALEHQAYLLAGCHDWQSAEKFYTHFAVLADQLPWPQDRDFGALLLQHTALDATGNLSQFLLTKALERAQWCAQCATSGGEGLARSAHIEELKEALEKL